MATLAAYDLAELCKPENLTVYVYGCPRTGNYAFARDYRIHVPNTWQVMTERVSCPFDAVNEVMRLQSSVIARSYMQA